MSSSFDKAWISRESSCFHSWGAKKWYYSTAPFCMHGYRSDSPDFLWTKSEKQSFRNILLTLQYMCKDIVQHPTLAHCIYCLECVVEKKLIDNHTLVRHNIMCGCQKRGDVYDRQSETDKSVGRIGQRRNNVKTGYGKRNPSKYPDRACKRRTACPIRVRNLYQKRRMGR